MELLVPFFIFIIWYSIGVVVMSHMLVTADPLLTRLDIFVVIIASSLGPILLIIWMFTTLPDLLQNSKTIKDMKIWFETPVSYKRKK